jgi:hypothetical protein
MNGWICLALWGGWIIIAIVWSSYAERAEQRNIQSWEKSARQGRISSGDSGFGDVDIPDHGGCGSGCGGCGDS